MLLSVTSVGRDGGPLGAGLPSGPDFRRLFEGAPGLYLVLDPQLTIVAVSNAFLAATNTTRENILGRNVSEVFPDDPDDPDATGTAILTASLDRVRSELRPDAMPVLHYDVPRSAAEGGGLDERYWSSRNNPLLDSRGKLAYILHEVVDVTEFVRQQGTGERLTEEFWANTAQIRAEILRRSAELAEANQALREANANRKQFLASMSHELRTPMNAVIGLAELLGNTTLSPPQSLRRRDQDGRPYAAVCDQRRPGRLEDRGGQARAERHRFLAGGRRRGCGRDGRRISPVEEPGGYRLLRAVAAGDPVRRPGPAAPGAAESRRERGEIHRAR